MKSVLCTNGKDSMEGVELTILIDLTKDNPDGSFTIIKSDIPSRIFLNMRDVMAVVETVNRKGNVYKNQCAIHHCEMGRIFLKHKYEYIKDLKENYGKLKAVTGYGYNNNTHKSRKVKR